MDSKDWNNDHGLNTFKHKQGLPKVSESQMQQFSGSGSLCQMDAESKQRNVSSSAENEKSSKNTQKPHMVSQFQTTHSHGLVEGQSTDASKHVEASTSSRNRGDKPVTCDVCDTIFSRSINLRKHKARVHKSEPFCKKCEIFFASLEELKQHEVQTVKHINKRNTTCGVCNKLFTSTTQLRFHKAKVHSSKPFCKKCRKVLASTETLQAHGEKCRANRSKTKK